MKKDNQSLRKKVSLRLAALKELDSPRVLESHGGRGLIFNRCYRHIEQGCVFEKNPEKASVLGLQRPAWSVYEGDSIHAIASGVGFDHDPNFFDLDPYGGAWEVIDAVFEGMRVKQDKIVFAVNDGLRQYVKLGVSWKTESLREMVESRGAGALYADYLDVCRELFSRKAYRAGYDLVKWVGYYCGFQNNMTHFAAVLRGTP